MAGDVSEIYQYRVPTLLGPSLALEEFRGCALLIVNTASACGFSGQMKSLQKLYEKYRSEGLRVLAFPSNDFNQEPLRDSALSVVCGRDGVDFPVFDVTHVRGPEKHGIFKALTKASGGVLGREILWNFEKFLVGRDGTLVERFRSYAPFQMKAIDRAVRASISR